MAIVIIGTINRYMYTLALVMFPGSLPLCILALRVFYLTFDLALAQKLRVSLRSNLSQTGDHGNEATQYITLHIQTYGL